MNPSLQANAATTSQKLKGMVLNSRLCVIIRPRFKNWGSLIAGFLAGQGIVQLLNLVIGFFLLRWLSVEAFAQYSVATGFQGTLVMLVDIGFSSSIVALAGNRGSDKVAIGRYIRSARHFRNRLFLVVAPLAVIAFPLVTAKHHWPLMTQLLLLLAILSAIFFQGWMSFYAAPLLINRNLRSYYQPQILSAFGRTLFCFLLYVGSALTSWAVVWLNAIVIAVTGLFYRAYSRPLVDEPVRSDPQTNREMLNYLSPLIPGIVFTAFQGQIAILLITLFGQTRSIAEVGALARLSQLFLLLGAFNSVVIGPYIAKITQQALIRRYFQILGIAVLISLVMLIMALLFPRPLLWVLGPKYQNLSAEVNWLVVVSCISYICGVMWTMHSARKWVYWWGTFAYYAGRMCHFHEFEHDDQCHLFHADHHGGDTSSSYCNRHLWIYLWPSETGLMTAACDRLG
jgi:O-antigen/teichoic acid export membrane protein